MPLLLRAPSHSPPLLTATPGRRADSEAPRLGPNVYPQVYTHVIFFKVLTVVNLVDHPRFIQY